MSSCFGEKGKTSHLFVAPLGCLPCISHTREGNAPFVPQGFPLLLFACILADFAGHFRFILVFFAGSASKKHQNKPFLSADGAKRAEKWKALTPRRFDLA